MSQDHQYYVTSCNSGECLTIPPMKELCEILTRKFEDIDKLCEYLREENEKLKNGEFEKQELKRLKERYDEMQADYFRGFPISEEEDKKVKKWMNEHEKKCVGGHGCVGGKYIYKFVPTSIGTIGKVVCSCGEEFTFQDL